uniref:Uncharacterized protein n=1 Tax=Sphaerodactylus townsendi TaxID=933632 RepID=A0ACB8F9A2_9SAUR
MSTSYEKAAQGHSSLMAAAITRSVGKAARKKSKGENKPKMAAVAPEGSDDRETALIDPQQPQSETENPECSFRLNQHGYLRLPDIM